MKVSEDGVVPAQGPGWLVEDVLADGAEEVGTDVFLVEAELSVLPFHS